MTTEPIEDSPPAGPVPRLARSAGILFAGGMASRLLGLAREMIIAYYFGASGAVSAFRVASQVPTLLYDFLIGGMLSAALVPVLSDYASRRDRGELIRLVGVLVSTFGLLLAAVVVVLELTAAQLAHLLAGGLGGFDPNLLPLTAGLIRLLAPAVWLFGMAGLLTAVLYALQRFTFPAIAAALYNLGIVLAAPLLAARLGVASLALGVLAGAAAQLVVIGWDLHRGRTPLRLRFDFRHPALRKIVRLYLPIAAGLLVSLFQVALDRRLASSTGAQSIAWMANATTLQQMPLGLISVAIALASLPSLSRHYAAGREDDYRRTLAQGLRMVLFFILPAAVSLWLLAEPVTRLLFERGGFTPADTEGVAAALRIYLVGMLFAAVDFPLNYAFYARNNTLLPALVGVISVGVYIVVALALLRPAGYLGLVWADSAKQGAHALMMGGLLVWVVGRLDGTMGRSLLRMAAGALLMAGAMAASAALLPSEASSRPGSELLRLFWVGGSGVAAYLFSLLLLGAPEARTVLSLAGARFGWRADE